MRIWLPAEAMPGTELGACLEPLPGDVRVEALPAGPHRSGGPRLDGTSDVEFAVLAPVDADRFAALLPGLTGLRVVQTLNAGVDWVPPLPDGVTLCNASGVHDAPVAEWIMAMLLATAKRLPHYVDAQRAARWDHAGNLAFGAGPAANGLRGAHVVVVGYGSIGRALARRLEPFEARVTGVVRNPRDGMPGPESLPELLPTADVVVLLAPATPDTRHLVDARFLAAMRSDALLINASRGSLVDHEALLEALRAGRVRAALDATEPEPLPDGHPLWSAPGVIITPHVAGSSAHWRHRAYRLAGEQIRAYAAGRPLRNVRANGY